MAKKHINGLIDRIKSYFLELNNLDNEAVSISSSNMVDPDDWAEITDKLRNTSIHLLNLNSTLAMALNTDEFTSALNSRKNLVVCLEDTLSRVRSEQPDSELILEYCKMLDSHKSTLSILEETDKFRSYPKSKKRYSKWLKKGLISSNYLPFNQLEKDLELISKLLEESK